MDHEHVVGAHVNWRVRRPLRTCSAWCTRRRSSRRGRLDPQPRGRILIRVRPLSGKPDLLKKDGLRLSANRSRPRPRRVPFVTSRGVELGTRPSCWRPDLRPAPRLHLVEQFARNERRMGTGTGRHPSNGRRWRRPERCKEFVCAAIGPGHPLKVETRVENVSFKTSWRNGPAWQVVYRYVTQEVHSSVKDASVTVRPRVQCGTSAGHMSPGSEPEALEQAADLRFLSWGGQDLNLRPTDYESVSDRAQDPCSSL